MQHAHFQIKVQFITPLLRFIHVLLARPGYTEPHAQLSMYAPLSSGLHSVTVSRKLFTLECLAYFAVVWRVFQAECRVSSPRRLRGPLVRPPVELTVGAGIVCASVCGAARIAARRPATDHQIGFDTRLAGGQTRRDSGQR